MVRYTCPVPCPRCLCSTRDPEAPAALADDVGTCLACCLPGGRLYVRPGWIDGALVAAVVADLGSLRAAADVLELDLLSVAKIYGAAVGRVPLRSDRFLARVAAAVDAVSRLH